MLTDAIEAEQAELEGQAGFNIDANIRERDLLCARIEELEAECERLEDRVDISTLFFGATLAGALDEKKEREDVISKMPVDANGEPCFLGDAVWHAGHKWAVVALSHKGKVCIREWAKRAKDGGGKWVKAKFVSHQARYLDANGKPINIGDTVYVCREGYRDKHIPRKVTGFDGEFVSTDNEHGGWYPENLTHEKPAEPDSAETILADMMAALDTQDNVELEGYIARYRKLTGGE